MKDQTDPESHVRAGLDVLESAEPTPSRPARRPSVIVPIRSLGANHRNRIATHLLCLNQQDRYMRFGYAASDSHIMRYVDSLDMGRDEIFGIYNRKLALIAMAHLAYPSRTTAESRVEFGVSVLSAARGRGYGARLFERASMHARNDGIREMIIHALSENTPMLKIARAAGGVVTRDGSESEAFITLPVATLDSRITEIVHEHMALTDYRMKQHLRQYENMLVALQVPSGDTERDNIRPGT